MAKMKLVRSSEYFPALVRPTGKLQSRAFVTSISFLNATHSNFLHVFFMRPAKSITLMFGIQNFHLKNPKT